MQTIEQLKCLRCGHKWYPRSPKSPIFCAACNSPYWDKPYQTKRWAKQQKKESK